MADKIPDLIVRYLERVLDKNRKQSKDIEADMDSAFKNINRYLGDSRFLRKYIQDLARKNGQVFTFFSGEFAAELLTSHIYKKSKDYYPNNPAMQKAMVEYAGKLVGKLGKAGHFSVVERALIAHKNGDAVLEGMDLSFLKGFIKAANLEEFGIAERIEKEQAEKGMGSLRHSLPSEVFALLGKGELKSKLGLYQIGTINKRLSKYFERHPSINISNLQKDRDLIKDLYARLDALPDSIKKIVMSKNDTGFLTNIEENLPHLMGQGRHKKRAIENLREVFRVISGLRILEEKNSMALSVALSGTGARATDNRNADSVLEAVKDLVRDRNRKGLQEYVLEKLNRSDLKPGSTLYNDLKKKDPLIFSVIMESLGNRQINGSFFFLYNDLKKKDPLIFSVIMESLGNRQINLFNVKTAIENRQKRERLDGWLRKSNNLMRSFLDPSVMSEAKKLGFDPSGYLSNNPRMKQKIFARLQEHLAEKEENIMQLMEKDGKLRARIIGSFGKTTDEADSRTGTRGIIKKYLEDYFDKNRDGIIRDLKTKFGLSADFFKNKSDLESFMGSVVQAHYNEAWFNYYSSIDLIGEIKPEDIQKNPKLEDKQVYKGLSVSGGPKTPLVNLPEIWDLCDRYKLGFHTGSTWEHFEDKYSQELYAIYENENWRLKRSRTGILKVMDIIIAMSGNPEFSNYRKFIAYADKLKQEVEYSLSEEEGFERYREVARPEDRNKTRRTSPRKEFDPNSRDAAEKRKISRMIKESVRSAKEETTDIKNLRKAYAMLDEAKLDARMGPLLGTDLHKFRVSLRRRLEEYYKEVGKGDLIHTETFKQDFERQYIQGRDRYIKAAYKIIWMNETAKEFREQALEQVYSERYLSLQGLFSSMSDRSYNPRNDARNRERRKQEEASLERTDDVTRTGARQDEMERMESIAGQYATVPQMTGELGISSIYDMLVRRSTTPEHIDEVMNYVYEIIPKESFGRAEMLHSPKFEYQNTEFTSLEALASFRRKELETPVTSTDVDEIKKTADERKGLLNTPGVTPI